MPSLYAPAEPLPPYAYVPGHDLPHPVTDPRGHSSHAHPRGQLSAAALLAHLPTDPAIRRSTLAATLTGDPQWLHALDLFNGGWYWEAHEAWESFWNALGRTTPEARFVQGLIHLAAAAVKIREGKPTGVARHTQRARELLGGSRPAPGVGTPAEPASGHGESPGDAAPPLGLASDSLAAVVAELERYRPECWHTSRAAVVRVVASEVRLELERRDEAERPVPGYVEEELRGYLECGILCFSLRPCPLHWLRPGVCDRVLVQGARGLPVL